MKTSIPFLGIVLLLAGLLRAQTNNPVETAAATNTVDTASLTNVIESAGKTNAVASTNLVTEILAERLEYESSPDSGSRAVYSGNVRVLDTQMELASDTMTIIFSDGKRRDEKPDGPKDAAGEAEAPGELTAPFGGKIEKIIAEGSVIILNKKDGNRAVGEKAVYSASNDIVELTGNPVLTTPQGSLAADVVTFDRKKNAFKALGSIRTVIPHADGGGLDKLMSRPSPGIQQP